MDKGPKPGEHVNILSLWECFGGITTRDTEMHQCFSNSSSVTKGFCRNSYLTKYFIPVVNAQETVATPKEDPALSLTDQILQKKPKNLIGDEDINKYLSSETGKDRLHDMFRKSDFGTASPELALVFSTTQTAAVISFMISSVLGGSKAREDFVREHEHVKFPTKFRAARAYQDAILRGGLKFGGLMGLKAGAFVFLLTGTAQSISVYRNKTSPLEYTAGGALTGSLFRMNLGLKGMFAGGVIGGFFGLVAGVVLWGCMNLTGETQEQRHYWQVHELLRLKKESKSLEAKQSS